MLAARDFDDPKAQTHARWRVLQITETAVSDITAICIKALVAKYAHRSEYRSGRLQFPSWWREYHPTIDEELLDNFDLDAPTAAQVMAQHREAV